MKRIVTIASIAVLIITLFASCENGGLDGTYEAKNDAARQSMYTKFIFKGSKVKVIMGTMGIEMPGGYEYGFKREGDKVSIELGVPGTSLSLGGIELHYNEKCDELSLLFGGEVGTALNEFAPVWCKKINGECKCEQNNQNPAKNRGEQDSKANTDAKKGGIFDWLFGGNSKEDSSSDKSNDKIDQDASTESEIKGTFSYSGGYKYGRDDKRGDFKTDFVFSTDYFNGFATEYNHKLAIMSLQLAMAAFGKHKAEYGEQKTENIKELLKNMDFWDIASYGYDKEPKEIDPNGNSIAATLARKELDKNTVLLVIAVRGGEYKQEWGGNFNVGNVYLGNGKKVHEGFNLAKEKIVTDYFEKYLWAHQNELSGKKVKLWITGYSRGAAVANLLSAYFVDKVKENGCYENRVKQIKLLLEKNDIYSYCFATPNNSKSAIYNDDNYDNIKSIISPFDPVPNFPFNSWGYYKYGKIYRLPNPQSTTYDYKKLEKAMLSKLDGLSSNNSLGLGV